MGDSTYRASDGDPAELLERFVQEQSLTVTKTHSSQLLMKNNKH